MVLVGPEAVFPVEVGDDCEVVVPCCKPEVCTEGVVFQLRDRRGQLAQGRYDLLDLVRGDSVVPAEQCDMPPG